MTREQYAEWKYSVDYVKELSERYDESGNHENTALYKQRDTGKLFIASYFNAQAIHRGEKYSAPIEVLEGTRIVEETFYIDMDGHEVLV
jgi:hypothetical protein